MDFASGAGAVSEDAIGAEAATGSEAARVRTGRRVRAMSRLRMGLEKSIVKEDGLAGGVSWLVKGGGCGMVVVRRIGVGSRWQTRERNGRWTGFMLGL